MSRRIDNGNWALPGGTIDLGESMVQAAVRETREETGIEYESTGLVGIYTDPKHLILYTSNGEVGRNSPSCSPRPRTAGNRRRVASQATCGGSWRGARRLSEGPFDAAEARLLPGRAQRLALSGMSWASGWVLAMGRACWRRRGPTASRISGAAQRIDRLTSEPDRLVSSFVRGTRALLRQSSG